MPGPAVETLLYLLDEAFEGNSEHGFLPNLLSVPHADWWTPPPGGSRSAAAIAGHVGACYLMYGDHAFGPARLSWGDPHVAPSFLREAARGHLEALTAWLRHAAFQFRDSVAKLDDDELTGLRPAPWGEPAETRWLISVLIQHSAYHAGEVNRIRSQLVGEDRWAWEIPES